MDTAGRVAMKDTDSLVRHAAMTAQEHDRLRSYIALNVIGSDPPPLTAEAQGLIRAMLGSGHTEESATA